MASKERVATGSRLNGQVAEAPAPEAPAPEAPPEGPAPEPMPIAPEAMLPPGLEPLKLEPTPGSLILKGALELDIRQREAGIRAMQAEAFEADVARQEAEKAYDALCQRIREALASMNQVKRLVGML